MVTNVSSKRHDAMVFQNNNRTNYEKRKRKCFVLSCVGNDAPYKNNNNKNTEEKNIIKTMYDVFLRCYRKKILVKSNKLFNITN